MAETVEARGQGHDRSLAKVKSFRVAIGSLLCHDKISWGCVATKKFYVVT